jgi:hypothetical protein
MLQEESTSAPRTQNGYSEEEWTGNYCEECGTAWKAADFEIMDDMQLKYSTDRKRVNTVHIGQCRFEVYIIPDDEGAFNFVVYCGSDTVSSVNGKTEDHCFRMLDNVRPVLEAYLKSKRIPVLREVADSYKMYHGMNSSRFRRGCGCSITPERDMHY